VEVSGVGYQVFVTHFDEYKVGALVEIFTYQVVREDDLFLVGFTSIEEKDVFTKLLSVKGIGPKTALNALSATNPVDILAAISSSNLAFLKNLPGIGPKAAAQIILDLKGKLADGTSNNQLQFLEVREGLKGLGFKVADIDKVLGTINVTNATSEEIMILALKNLRK
jgi:Holliday junction DNA helicase RuvA